MPKCRDIVHNIYGNTVDFATLPHMATKCEATKACFPLPELTARVDWRVRVSTSRVDGPCWRPSTRLVETRTRQHSPCWQVMETGHPSTLIRAVNSGSGNRA